MVIVRFFSNDSFDEAHKSKISNQLGKFDAGVNLIKVEKCFHIELSTNLATQTENVLQWLLKHPQKQSANCLRTSSSLSVSTSGDGIGENSVVIEIGPRFNFSTPFSTNCVNICHNVGLSEVKRVEVSTRYLIGFTSKACNVDDIIGLLSDNMTECRYTKHNLPVNSFDERLPKTQDSWYTVPVLKNGRQALEEVNAKLGLAFGDWDLDFYTDMFVNILKRDPTTVELFDCAQSNSEHSRHWFFKGKLIVDGIAKEKSLIEMIGDTQVNTNQNNTIKFSDNSSAMLGYSHKTLRPTNFIGPGPMEFHEINSDLIFTAETHNMPTAVAPFSGATTGTGGRLRDVQGVGRGGIPIAGTAGYCVGALNIPEYPLSYEDGSLSYPPSFATPLKIIIEASNGASDYGNKFGEPVISGFAVSYGLKNVVSGDRDEYVKPIMFSGGLGIMDATMRKKIDPEKGMLLAKIGGPVYRIGVGGGAASSVEIQGDNSAELDFNAVQRGDPEMENKLNRVVRCCIEMCEKNPILAIHDQGAGGNGNVLKELVEPGFAGAVIFSKEFQLGDPTINALELWGAEYQENNAILCKTEHRELLQEICDRERCPINFVGIVTGDGFVSLIESEAQFDNYLSRENRSKWGDLPFDMELRHVLGDMPRREYKLDHIEVPLASLEFPSKIDYSEALNNVLSVLSVGSKRFLTSKVDRCVTGLIAQQQCVGPLHTPLADFGLVAISHFGFEGIATSIGTQPTKTILSAKAMARMSVAEALSNLVFVKISELADVKCSGNWMWAAKLPGEGAKMYDACAEMCHMMKDLNIAIDGGKDSLSMAARVNGETVKSPGTLVVSTYAPCPDIRIKTTPDLKSPARKLSGELVWINIEGKFRLGGSALAQSFAQQGNNCPNLEQTEILKNAFNITQELLKNKQLLAGHDISDGGLIVCLLEMAFAGLSGIKIDLTNVIKTIPGGNIELQGLEKTHEEFVLLFAEESGWVLEVDHEVLPVILSAFKTKNVPAYHIGQSVGYGVNSLIEIVSCQKTIINGKLISFLKQWERTSFELEKLQSNVDCAKEEYRTMEYRTGPTYECTFNPDAEIILNRITAPIRVAVVREEGVNSDREMISSLIKSNFEVHDVCMHDLQNNKTTLDLYQGLIFPGGFSYADTLGSAKGWAANIMFSNLLAPQFQNFRNRSNTFSLGICNGCQLMSLIGWVGDDDDGNIQSEKVVKIPDVAVLHNKSERFECRWSTVKITKSNSVLLRRMQGSVIGCWIAHGEGRFSFKNSETLTNLKKNNCVALQYVDDNQKPTEIYPMNPNGSVEGIAGLCSKNGRHLALMPHPERCSSMFQWPYISPEFKVSKSPWQAMFDEAYNFCTEHQ